MNFDHTDIENLDMSGTRDLLADLFVRMGYSPAEVEAQVEERIDRIKRHLAEAPECSGPRPAKSPVPRTRRETCPCPP